MEKRIVTDNRDLKPDVWFDWQYNRKWLWKCPGISWIQSQKPKHMNEPKDFIVGNSFLISLKKDILLLKMIMQIIRINY